MRDGGVGDGEVEGGGKKCEAYDGLTWENVWWYTFNSAAMHKNISLTPATEWKKIHN